MTPGLKPISFVDLPIWLFPTIAVCQPNRNSEIRINNLRFFPPLFSITFWTINSLTAHESWFFFHSTNLLGIKNGCRLSDYELTTTALKKLNLNAFLLIAVVAKDTITARCLAMKNTIKDKKPDRIASHLCYYTTSADLIFVLLLILSSSEKWPMKFVTTGTIFNATIKQRSTSASAA